MRPPWMTDRHVIVLERLAEADSPMHLDDLATTAPMDPLLQQDRPELRAVCEPLEATGLIATAGPDEFRVTARGRRFLAGTLPSRELSRP